MAPIGKSKEEDGKMIEELTDAGIIASLQVYAKDGIQIHTMLRDAFLEKDNTMGVLKHQGSLDSLQDIMRIMGGEKIATLAEMRAEMKKTDEVQGQGYTG